MNSNLPGYNGPGSPHLFLAWMHDFQAARDHTVFCQRGSRQVPRNDLRPFLRGLVRGVSARGEDPGHGEFDTAIRGRAYYRKCNRR